MFKMSTDFSYSGLFNFGLPLEDIFPPNQIHPSLKLLFERAFVETVKSSLKIDSILKGYQGSLDERIALKRRLLAGKLPKSTSPTGAWLWLVRHFLGLLPLPLFPKFTDGKFYDWDSLAVACRSCGLKKSAEINKIIKRNIANMPKENVMLVILLMTFFRKISCYYFFGKQTRLDKYAVIAVVKYFSSSLFLRPYMPGHVTNKDRMYFPLTFYLIYNWLSIDIHLGDEDEISFSTALLLPLIKEEKIKIHVCKETISEKSVESGDVEMGVIEEDDREEEYARKQEITSVEGFLPKEKLIKARDSLKIVVEPSVQHEDKEVETQRVNLRDWGCQTDLIMSEFSFSNRVDSYAYSEADGKSKSEPLVRPIKRNHKKVEKKVSNEKNYHLHLIYKADPSSTEVDTINDKMKCDCQKKKIDNFKSSPFTQTPGQKLDEFCANIKLEPDETNENVEENVFNSNLRSISDTFLYEDMPLKATNTSSKLLESETSFYERIVNLNRTVKDVFSMMANKKKHRKLRSRSPLIVKTKSSANLKVKTSKLEMLKKIGLPISSSSPNIKYRKLMTL